MFNWFNFLTYAVITAATPGPNNLMSMSNGTRHGFKKSLRFNLGILVGFTIVTLLCTVLTGTLYELIPKIKLPMLIVGAGYMLFLAWKTFTSSPEIHEKSAENSFLSGLALQFINPKIYIYCIVSMDAYILPFYRGDVVGLVLFSILLSVIGFVFTVVWSGFGSALKVFFSKYARVTNTVMALLLVYCAVSLFL